MSAGISMSPMLILMALFSGGPNELLDAVPTGMFWQARGVEMTPMQMLAEISDRPPANVAELVRDLGAKEFQTRQVAQERLSTMGSDIVPALKEAAESGDPEVTVRARQVIEAVSKKANDGDIRRLMAIRALGELRARQAIGRLREISKSEVPFEAEYASRAIAAIEGSEAPRKTKPSDDERMKDVLLLPKECGLAAQVVLEGGAMPDVAKAFAPFFPPERQEQADRAAEQVARMAMETAQKIGNVRVDVLTLGVSGDMDGDQGFLMLIVRGRYNPARMIQTLVEQHRRSAPAVETVGGVDFYRPDREVAIAFPSPACIVLVAGPARRAPLPLEAAAGAVQAGRGTLTENKALAGAIEKVDRSGRFWAAATVTETYAKLVQQLSPFESVAVSGKAADGGMSFVATADGQDAEKAAEFVKELEESLARLIEQAKDPQTPSGKTIEEFLTGVKVTREGGRVSVSATATGHAPLAMLPMLSHRASRPAPVAPAVQAK